MTTFSERLARAHQTYLNKKQQNIESLSTYILHLLNCDSNFERGMENLEKLILSLTETGVRTHVLSRKIYNKGVVNQEYYYKHDGKYLRFWQYGEATVPKEDILAAAKQSIEFLSSIFQYDQFKIYATDDSYGYSTIHLEW